ncbi:hypothetical protein TSOC_003791 [Tetrabaena socialis]|uniref:Uncharacterized protein n=1 Tax=Tetrabaena socialis TaxID=47790 RepID=A0A2J8AAK6_9CHLO|nr:hypothetical protein TSOC_003791 [Tetrabaena socialis]|eukprot:PNH09552.1 hypothetical protein TSOC_003791 [Tetrabaena socialis]
MAANGLPREFKKLERFQAVPKSRATRDEVASFEPIICLMELIDNAVEATMGRSEPRIKIDVLLDGPRSQLVIEDNGKGMSLEALQNYFRTAYTTSSIPEIPRGAQPGVLPLQHFVNRRLNRFGRGSAASVYFGNFVQIESYMANAECEYMVQYDYGDQIRTDTYNIDPFEREQIVLDEDNDDSWTIIRIQQLLADKLRNLGDAAFLEGIAKQLNQVYHTFVYGIPEFLWATLPADLTRGSERPKGGLSIELRATDAEGNKVFFTRLAPGAPSEHQSDLQRVLCAYQQQAELNRLLQPCVTCFRYLPAGHPNMVGAGAAAGSVPYTPRQPAAAMPAASSTAAYGGARATAAAQGAQGNTDVSDIDTRLIDSPCDAVFIWFYFPYNESNRTKPQSDKGQELFVFPFWSGKDMVKSKLHGQFPKIHRAAVALARSNQETQDDDGGLVGEVWMANLEEALLAEGLTRPWGLDPGHWYSRQTGAAGGAQVEQQFVTLGRKYLTGRGFDPLEKGEMVIHVDPAKANNKRDEEVGGKATVVHRMAHTARIVGLFILTGNDFAKQCFAAVRPWRPSWSPLAGLISESLMELRPVLPNTSKDCMKLVKRQQARDGLVQKWEALMPRRLLPDAQVATGQPAALAAFFVEAGSARAASSRCPMVRLGEPMPDLAVQLLDSRKRQVAWAPDLVERMRARFSPAGPLAIAAEVKGDRLNLKLRQQKQGGGGVSVSEDKMTLFVSGLYIKPLGLKQTVLGEPKPVRHARARAAPASSGTRELRNGSG